MENKVVTVQVREDVLKGWMNGGGSSGSGGEGIPIVSSEAQLETLSADLGSLAVVAEAGSVQLTSMRNLYQPTMADVGQTPGTLLNPEKFSQVSSLVFDIPQTAPATSEMGVFVLVPRDMGETNLQIMYLMFSAEGGAGMLMTPEYQGSEFILYTYENGSLVLSPDYQTYVDYINNLLATQDWVYFGNPETAITEAQFDTIDMFVKVRVSAPSKANLYSKKDNWEQVYANELAIMTKKIKELNTSVEGKTDKIQIEQRNNTNNLVPNRYYTYTITSTSQITLRLGTIEDSTVYNEYIIELKCIATPTSVSFTYYYSGNIVPITWANGAAPVFSEGFTYLISISNGLGVFSMFPNS